MEREEVKYPARDRMERSVRRDGNVKGTNLHIREAEVSSEKCHLPARLMVCRTSACGFKRCELKYSCGGA